MPLGLIGLIYDSINNPEVSNEFLVKFADRMRASAAIGFHFSDEGKRRHVRAAVGLDSKWWPLFDEHYVHVSPYWLDGVMRSHYPLGIPTLGEQHVAPAALVKTEYYNDFMRPQNFFHSIGLMAAADRFLIAVRPERAGAFNPDEMQVLQALAPHIIRTTEIQRQIETLKRIVHHEPIDSSLLITKLHLTAAEAQLAAALFRGDSPEGYATATRHSINTIRWQLKCIYAKTGVHRQTELIKIIARALA
jgi:DNA-binding CsgD family transcriptional regulator